MPSINGTIPFNQAPISRGSPPLPEDRAAPLSAPPTSLPQIIDKDWELNLDALEARTPVEGLPISARVGTAACGRLGVRQAVGPVCCCLLASQAPRAPANDKYSG